MMFEYKNHYQMKKNRLIVLNNSNWTCAICGGKAKEVHHIDESKENHATENLLPVCRKCHIGMAESNKKPLWDIDMVMQAMMHRGMDKKELAAKINISTAALYNIFRTGKTKNSTMKKIACTLEYPLEAFIISGEVPSGHDRHLKLLDEEIEKAVASRMDANISQTEAKRQHRLLRYWLTQRLREEFGLSSWTLVGEGDFDKALTVVTRWAQKEQSA